MQAALNKGAADEGGYLAPVEWDRSITDRLVIVSDMRQLANVQPCSGAGLTKLYNTGGTSSGYTVYDRKGVRVLRDPYTNKPYVMFYTTKRVGGGVHNPEPMRALKIAASA